MPHHRSRAWRNEPRRRREARQRFGRKANPNAAIGVVSVAASARNTGFWFRANATLLRGIRPRPAGACIWEPRQATPSSLPAGSTSNAGPLPLDDSTVAAAMERLDPDPLTSLTTTDLIPTVLAGLASFVPIAMLLISGLLPSSPVFVPPLHLASFPQFETSNAFAETAARAQPNADVLALVSFEGRPHCGNVDLAHAQHRGLRSCCGLAVIRTQHLRQRPRIDLP